VCDGVKCDINNYAQPERLAAPYDGKLLSSYVTADNAAKWEKSKSFLSYDNTTPSPSVSDSAVVRLSLPREPLRPSRRFVRILFAKSYVLPFACDAGDPGASFASLTPPSQTRQGCIPRRRTVALCNRALCGAVLQESDRDTCFEHCLPSSCYLETFHSNHGSQYHHALFSAPEQWAHDATGTG
jgi:hypothetical protein